MKEQTTFALGLTCFPLVPGDFRSLFERSRGHSRPLHSPRGHSQAPSRRSEPPGSPLELPRSRRKASSSLPEPSGGCPRDPEAREYLRKLDKTKVGATWASRASVASRWLLPELLEPRDGCSKGLWSLEIAAASRKLSRRRSKKLRSSLKTPSSKALSD